MHTNEYFEYLLDDLGYMGENMFIMCHSGQHELALGVDLDVVSAYNKMYAIFIFFPFKKKKKDLRFKVLFII